MHRSAVTLTDALEKLGYYQLNTAYFDTIRIKADVAKISALAKEQHVNFYYPDSGTVSIAVNETTGIDDLNCDR